MRLIKFSALISLIGLFAACNGAGNESANPGRDQAVPEDAVTSESDLTYVSFSGDYAPATEEDGYSTLSFVKIVQHGPKLTVELDTGVYDLVKVRDGAYVFSSEELWGDCDDPGCGDVIGVSGVVYQKKVGTKLVPAVKVNVVTQYSHPEYDGDREGEVEETLRWIKKTAP